MSMRDEDPDVRRPGSEIHYMTKEAQDSKLRHYEENLMAQAGAQQPVTQGAAGLTLANVEHAFTYQPWDPDQAVAGDIVREVLIAAAKAFLRVVPAGPSRTRALNNLIDARMLANQGITFRGRF